MCERDELKERAAKSGDNEIHSQYKLKRNLVTTRLKSAKVDYYRKKFDKEDLSSGEVWKSASQILGKVRSVFWKMITFGASLLSLEKGWWVAVGRSAVLLCTQTGRVFLLSWLP